MIHLAFLYRPAGEVVGGIKRGGTHRFESHLHLLDLRRADHPAVEYPGAADTKPPSVKRITRTFIDYKINACLARPTRNIGGNCTGSHVHFHGISERIAIPDKGSGRCCEVLYSYIFWQIHLCPAGIGQVQCHDPSRMCKVQLERAQLGGSHVGTGEEQYGVDDAVSPITCSFLIQGDIPVFSLFKLVVRRAGLEAAAVTFASALDRKSTV